MSAFRSWIHSYVQVLLTGAMSVAIAAIVGLTGCMTIIDQDEVGVRDNFGVFSKEASGPGLKFYFWPMFDVRVFSVSTRNIEVSLDLPSKEGLNVAADVSILYRIYSSEAPRILSEVGQNFEASLLLPVFRSSAADITAKFEAKDMHTGQRAEIEKAIQQRMRDLLDRRGFEIEAVLLKSIKLPAGLASSIEQKLQAEQESQRMVFVLQAQRQEAERRLIDAKATRDAQQIVNQGLTEKVLNFNKIEAFRELSRSPNTKVIITDGKTPLLLRD